MISAQKLQKTFTVHKKAPGFWGSARSLFVRDKVEKHAVRGVDFEVNEGEIVGLIGANGAGKTTLVKMLTGIIHPSGGEARVLGFDPWQRDNRFRRQIALIMGQKAQLWWDLPAGDCFLLLKEIYQISDEDYKTRLAELTEMLDVADQIDVQIRRLSLGERMKMELIAALLHRPRAVFLDEPTIGLDLTSQRNIRDFLLHYREQHQPAMILTSHYMEDIERLCKRILILREGEIVYDGALDNVVHTYAANKMVTAHLRRRGLTEEDFDDATARRAIESLGKIESLSETEIRVSVPRDKVADAASAVLAHYPVADLNIEEADIGTIIERILSSKDGNLS